MTRPSVSSCKMTAEVTVTASSPWWMVTRQQKGRPMRCDVYVMWSSPWRRRGTNRGLVVKGAPLCQYRMTNVFATWLKFGCDYGVDKNWSLASGSMSCEDDISRSGCGQMWQKAGWHEFVLHTCVCHTSSGHSHVETRNIINTGRTQRKKPGRLRQFGIEHAR